MRQKKRFVEGLPPALPADPPARANRSGRRIAWTAAFAVLLAIPPTFLLRSSARLRDAERAADPADRARSLDSAVGTHFPGNPSSTRAMALLLADAREAARRSPAEGLVAFRRVRTAAASVRWLASPFAAEEREAAAAVARFESPELAARRVPPRLPPPDPSPVATLLLLPALAAFVVVGFRALRPRGLDRRLALLSAGGAAATFLLLALA